MVVEGRQYISTLRIPYTSGSELKLRVQKTLQDVQGPSRTKVKLVEEVGESTKHHLVKSDPFPREWCGRERCPLTSASTTCMSKCYTTNINYEFYCKRCDAKIIEREEERRERGAGRGGEGGQEEGQEGQDDDEELEDKKPQPT